MKTIVTTDRKCHSDSVALAGEMAAKLNIELIDRNQQSVAGMMRRYEAQAVLVAKGKELHLYTAEGELFFHPNMSQLRVKNIRLGDKDHMAEAMELKEGMSVLDCTLGFGADAIVASFVVGESGRVTGIEASPLIAAVTGYGLQNFLASNYELHAAMRRIEVHNSDALDFLRQQADKSYDVVYFDPMFRHPLRSSTNINPLRSVADARALTVEAVTEAKRVARRRVVMKEARGSAEFARLGFAKIAGGKWSKINFGIISVE
ncbi:MAG: class I SAM-dependent methyltransferase [Anaerovibrio sp.]|nr:class I SAM-dependent methyltransferase [Selenomonadaceae bacterium]MDD6397908.1 class I SAM-dependent methyltransferase [Selenomonadaceae bacterium]MDY6053633.1 class I SAM-dependent methyltransferase [Anaerovibrio sp.]